VFDDGPILGFFSPAIEEARTLLAEVDKVANLAAEGIWAEGVQDHFAGVFASMIRRMKQFGHGGTVVALPDDYTADDPRIRDLIDIKYVLQDLELRHAFHSFLKSQWNAARHGHPKVEGDEKIEPDKVRVMLRHSYGPEAAMDEGGQPGLVAAAD